MAETVVREIDAFQGAPMAAAIDPVEVQAVIDRLAPQEGQAVYGVFDKSRVPALHFKTFTTSHLSAAVSPDCSYRLVKAAIDAATTTLDLYIYNVSAQHLVDLLAAARDRGVTVRVMYDVMDTNGNERAKLNGLGVPLKEAPSSGGRKVFTVCHQKFAVIDGRALLIGSANWAGTSIPLSPVAGKFKKGNREWLLHVEDKHVAEWFQTLFNFDWDIPSMQGPAGLTAQPAAGGLNPLDMPMQAFTPPDEVFDIFGPELTSEATLTPLTSPDNYSEEVLKLIRNAQSSIFIEQQYIKVGGPRTKALLTELAARRDDVDIRIIVSPAFKESWDATVASLKAFGIDDRLRAMNLDFYTHLHNKGLLIDRRISVVTSTNWSENSIEKAREAGLIIESEELGGYYGSVFDFDWRISIDPADVANQLAALGAQVTAAPANVTQIHPSDLR